MTYVSTCGTGEHCALAVWRTPHWNGLENTARTGGTDPDLVGQSDPVIDADLVVAIGDVDFARSVGESDPAPAITTRTSRSDRLRPDRGAAGRGVQSDRLRPGAGLLGRPPVLLALKGPRVKLVACPT